MSFLGHIFNVVAGAGVGFLMGGPAGAVAGGVAAAVNEGKSIIAGGLNKAFNGGGSSGGGSAGGGQAGLPGGGYMSGGGFMKQSSTTGSQSGPTAKAQTTGKSTQAAAAETDDGAPDPWALTKQWDYTLK